MYKMAGAAVLGLVVGTVVAYLVAQSQLAAVQGDSEADRRRAAAESRDLARQLDMLRQSLEQSESEAVRLNEVIKSLHAELETTSTALAESDAALPGLDAGSGELDGRTAPTTGATGPNKAGGNDARPQSFAESYQSAVRFRAGLQAYMDGEISKAQDPLTAERLATLSNSLQQQLELVQQLRDAKTDAERDTIRQNMTDLRDSTRDIVHEQQDVILRQLAASFGISAPDMQEQFIRAFRDIQNSPFFRVGGGFAVPVPVARP